MSHAYRFILKPSRIVGAGVGCFSTTPVPRGAPLSSNPEGFVLLALREIPDEYLKYCVLLEHGKFLSPKDFLRMGVFWYINHAKHPNLLFEQNRLIAAQDLAPDTELTLYYSDLLTHPKHPAWVREEHV